MIMLILLILDHSHSRPRAASVRKRIVMKVDGTPKTVGIGRRGCGKNRKKKKLNFFQNLAYDGSE